MLLALVAATPATAHIVQSRPKAEDQTHHHSIYKKYLPVTHACSEVPVLFHAEDHTVPELEDVCGKLKEAEVRFHTLLGTDGDNPRRDFKTPLPIDFYYFRHRETLIVAERDRSGKDVPEDFHNGIYGFSYIYSITTADHYIEVHEFAHFLDDRFGGGIANFGLFPIWIEGLATFIHQEHRRQNSGGHWYSFMPRSWSTSTGIIRDGIQLGFPDSRAFVDATGAMWRDMEEKYGLLHATYTWGSWYFRFLDERHSAALLDLVEIFRGLDEVVPFFLKSELGNDLVVRIHDVVDPLNDDWLEWLRDFTRLAVVEASEPLVAVDGTAYEPVHQPFPGIHGTFSGAIFDLSEYFRTVQNLSFEMSSLNEREASDGAIAPTIYIHTTAISIWVPPRMLQIVPYGTGTWDFTITATTPDGQSAELPFTVVVVERLTSGEIVVGDPLSTDEERTVINLNHFFDGPEDIAFAAESANAEVATVAVTADGRLVVSAVAPGEAEITVRAASLGQESEQTFTIVVSDECPSWLCRSFLTGWRAALAAPSAGEQGDTSASR